MGSRGEWRRAEGILPSAASSSYSVESMVFDHSSPVSDVTNHTQYSLKSIEGDKYDLRYQHPVVEEGHVSEWELGHPRMSQMTYESTVSSSTDDEDDISEASSEDSHDRDRCPKDNAICVPAALASTPRNFDQYFPTRDRLTIRHDDSTLDGNMNLRVDTSFVLPSGRKKPLTLFHLRMHDLKSRDFSLRRYCRDSGREVSHSARQYKQQLPPIKPSLKRTLSNAFAGLRRRDSIQSQAHSVSTHRDSFTMAEDDEKESERRERSRVRYPTNKIKLEFSNYAHIDVVKCTGGPTASYKFDYWGSSYTWKKQIDEHGLRAYRLLRNGSEFPCAHIVQDVLTAHEAEEEETKGGWVPPCSLWITDDQILNAPDVAE